MTKKEEPDVFSGDLRKKIYESSRKRIESLWHAAMDGDIPKVKEIIEAGYHDVNGGNRWQSDIDPNGWQRTPLHAAVLRSNIELARFLLSNGAEVNCRTKYGDTPLHFAAEGCQLEMVKLLLAKGADSALKNDDDETPLDIARKYGFGPIEKLLESEKRKGR